MTDQKDSSFQHKDLDKKYQEFWEKLSTDQEVLSDENKVESKHFKMILPPPNITGTLHLGHALNITIQDMIARYRRLKGQKVTWIPGVDHAGIATQVVVEKQLMKEKKQSRHDLGREEFLKKVWDWKDKNNKTISEQLKTMCPMIDYQLEQFTLSPELSEAVTDAFIELYESKQIYRDLRMVDYCCHLKTVISNIEVEEKKVDEPIKHTTPDGIKVDLGYMYNIRYPIDETSLTAEQKEIVSSRNITDVIVGTTRPETLFGDVAVAVNPTDSRFQGLDGILLSLPLTNRKIKLIFDDTAKQDMGTGAVKITPAHDPKDWACYQRTKEKYDLPKLIEVIDDNGQMILPPDVTKTVLIELDKKNRYICRKIVLEMLEDNKLLAERKKHSTTVRLCSRSGDILEYRLKHQWYVNTEDMSQKSIDAVKTGKIKIIPDPDKQYEATWYRFLSEARSWCISRQLWWGHRIPAYKVIYCDSQKIKTNEDSRKTTKEDSGTDSEEREEWIVAKSLEEAKLLAKEKYPDFEYESDYVLRQDEDVLDTWFSSGIYPFTVLKGQYFPLDVLETGKDILFFWVARMVMLSFALRNKVPFKTIYLHNIIRDKDGLKMSKSLGNIIDPLDIIYGITRPEMEDRIKNSNLSEKEITRALQNIKKNFPNGIATYGVDTLRMGLVFYLRQGTDINLDISIFKMCHAMLNKLWNVLNMYKLTKEQLTKEQLTKEQFTKEQLLKKEKTENAEKTKQLKEIQEYIDCLSDKYLDYSLYENYDFSGIYDNINQYVMYNYCPFYLEAIKFFDPDQKLLEHFEESFSKILHYLHPIAPNATDEMFKTLTREHLHDNNYHEVTHQSRILESLTASKVESKSKHAETMSTELASNIDSVREIIHHINSKLTAKTKAKREIELECNQIKNMDYFDLIKFMTRSEITISF